MTMNKTITNVATGETVSIPLTAEEIAEREAWARDVLPGLERKQAEANRAAAYRSEADPLFFKAQRGEATTDEWTAKVAEIKARFPYPGGDQ
jgi:hypothetical protein